VCAELCAEDVAVGADDAQHDHSAVVAGDLDERGGIRPSRPAVMSM